MSPAKITLLVLVVLCGVMALSVGGCVISTKNSEIRQRNAVLAQSEGNEASLDTMVKIIKQKAGVVVKLGEDRQQIYEELVSGRSGGMLFKALSEATPNMDATVYKDLMGSIEAERKTFKRDQQKLLDLVRERQNLCEQFPSSVVLSIFGENRPFKRKGVDTTESDYPYQYIFVTSASTKQMVEDGEENETDLFN